MITITPELEAKIVKEARADLVNALLTKHKNEFNFISPSQAAGLLDISINTLLGLPIPRYAIVPRKIIKYRISEILAYLKTIKEA